GIYPAIEVFDRVDGILVGHGISFTKSISDLKYFAGRFPEVIDVDFKSFSWDFLGSQWDRQRLILSGHGLRSAISDLILTATTTENVGAFDLMAVRQLALVYLINSAREPRNDAGSYGRYDGGYNVRIFRDPNEGDQEKIVTGAIMLV